MSIFKYFYEPRNMFLNVLKWCPLDGKTYRRKTLPSFALVWTRPHFKLYWFPKDSFAAHPNDINNKRVAGHWGPTVLWHKTTTDWYFTPPPKTSHKPKQASPLPSLPTVHRPTLPPHNPPPLCPSTPRLLCPPFQTSSYHPKQMGPVFSSLSSSSSPSFLLFSLSLFLSFTRVPMKGRHWAGSGIPKPQASAPVCLAIQHCWEPLV